MFLTERIVIGLVWFICFVSLWLIPKDKRKDSTVIFLIAQLFAWILGLIVVELGLIIYPVREFEKANATFFSFEYIVFPFLCIFLIIKFPNNKGFLTKIIHYVKLLGPFAFFEVMAERYTQLITYIHWQWYDTFFSMCLVIYLVKVVYKWFFKM